MTENSFFNEQKEQSLIKARIVEKYFWAWAKVIISKVKKGSSSNQKIAYVDLFAGAGRYKDGSKSTPVKVLETAIADPDMRNMLVSIFNDADVENVNSLQQAIDSIPGIENLKYPPHIFNHEVGENIVKTFQSMKLVPTLLFVDPWGYKGLSLQLVNSVVKDWGCDCIFFFNYNRINMGLNNDAVKEHINALFGQVRADQLRELLKTLTPQERELTVVEYICEALKEMGGKYVLPFRFRHEMGNRTSHHLIFVSKHPKGYEIMKEIMAKESSEQTQGVPSFEYNPATLQQPLLFELTRPLDQLESMLLDTFSGKTMTMAEIYDQHHVGKPYIKKNYKDALRNLESQGKITVHPPAGKKRRKGTFADDLKVTFPVKQ
ncbi:MAG: three-Cys-motif partner protein TcmP [Microcystis viridis Mv_BB_P_19951000_S69]|uniref:Three-Cys-motif partner protein TcmP n=1 Tax=Microcystis viridis Mv_BB_P_19951000_S68D TaxID=2486270 RepID=A0A552I0L9_MICVR|nr:MAG: three-Cys-motif partner protein TcmP [Microcystis viridis Mv_BB_P_19951000_S69]TRU77016.1 MAG: three-Cys-motif partner protein TcmP [Microcystis viridis Mv_BB_P_19951000_S68D]TRU77442.1 MAG: three-Cys-motif partner protein TcmP [Microcystis viridis Mv_BB_P_19951000_S68]TRU81242.1 MAG: three-Cys-motif partner protein TcmP [Microcystis viridis Mv_BB_P_19951000_S69D]